ncbi:MAG: hypothetical protein ACRDJW_02315 [Thermomicrobiales bacterium]
MIDAFEVVEPRPPEGLSLYLRTRQSQWLFRVAPARDPAQPRLWCLRFDRCVRTGPLADDDQVSLFVAARGMTRDQLMGTLQNLRTDPAAWLGQSEQRDLHRWLRKASAAPFDIPHPLRARPAEPAVGQ